LLCVFSFQQNNETKDSIIARVNRNDFTSIYQLADTNFFHTSEQNLTKIFTNNKRSFGQIVNSAFLADSVWEGCDSCLDDMLNYAESEIAETNEAAYSRM
jgi:hypothetical protein